MKKTASLRIGFVSLCLMCLLLGCSTNSVTSKSMLVEKNSLDDTKPGKVFNEQKPNDYSQYIATKDKLPDFVQELNKLEAGADFYFIEFADENKIVLRNYAYLIVMKHEDKAWRIESSLDLRPIDCTHTQGDACTQVHVLQNGNVAYIQNVSVTNEQFPPLYEFDIEKHTLFKKDNSKIPAYEASGTFDEVEGGIYQIPDGYRFKLKNESDKQIITVFNKDDSVKRHIEMDNGSIELGYIGKNIIVQIAYPSETKDMNTSYWAKCRLIFYNLESGEVVEQLITENF